MRPVVALALLAGIALSPPVRAQTFDFTRQTPVRANSPGLECRQIQEVIEVRQAPNPAAPRISMVASHVAITGPAVNGYLPVELTGRRPGWVLASQTWPNTRVKSCFVERQRDGRLLISVFNRIQ